MKIDESYGWLMTPDIAYVKKQAEFISCLTDLVDLVEGLPEDYTNRLFEDDSTNDGIRWLSYELHSFANKAALIAIKGK